MPALSSGLHRSFTVFAFGSFPYSRYGAWRVNGVLSVARAIGDRKLKQWVIGRPDVAEFDLTDSQEYLVLGCDGLWDVLTPEKVSIVRSCV